MSFLFVFKYLTIFVFDYLKIVFLISLLYIHIYIFYKIFPRAKIDIISIYVLKYILCAIYIFIMFLLLFMIYCLFRYKEF